MVLLQTYIPQTPLSDTEEQSFMKALYKAVNAFVGIMNKVVPLG